MLVRRLFALVAIALASSTSMLLAVGFNPAAAAGLSAAAAIAAAVSTFVRDADAREAASSAPQPPPAEEAIAGPADPAPPTSAPSDPRLAEIEAKAESLGAMAASASRRLRFALAVLQRVPKKTEEAAFSLMGSLVALRDNSESAANSANEAAASANDAEAIKALANSARATIGRVRNALAEMRKHDKEAAIRLHGLGRELETGIELLDNIEDISERSRLIAFNMSIEAARIGEKGSGLKVIVGELRALNDRTMGFSSRVAQLLANFRKYNESLLETSQINSDLVSREVERGLGEEEAAIESLLAASTAVVDLSGILSAVRRMNKELDGVLESLQFQDITRQMIEGVLQTIAEAVTDIAPVARRGDEKGEMEKLRSTLLARAKMQCEKEAIQEVT